MPNLEYPQPIAAPHGSFDPIPDVTRSEEARLDQLQRRAGQIHLGPSDGEVVSVNLRRAPSALVGVLRLHVSVGSDHSTSFHNGADTVKAVSVEPCAFCPVEDVAAVSWKVRNEEFIEEATLEVYGARLRGPISRRDVTAELTNGRGVAPGCNGGLPLADALAFTVDHDQRFPSKVLTAEFSPYRFALKIKVRADSGREGYPTAAWTFAQVLVHSIELSWGEERFVPAGAQPGVIDPHKDGRFRGLERALVLDLVRNADISASPILLRLDTDVFSANHIDPAGTISSPLKSSNDAFKMLWGDGPRIPVEATVYARKHDGSKASLAASRRAVGGVHLLWDWSESSRKLDDWLAGAKATYPYISKRTLERLMTADELGSPPGSSNCPLSNGGKRGGTSSPVFMTQDDQTVWGNGVELAGGDRVWCAVSRAGNGPFRGAKSLVMFQPAPVSGDRYRVSVYLTHEPNVAAADDTPEANVADVPEQPSPMLGVPPRPLLPLHTMWSATHADKRLPAAHSGTFEVMRRARVRVVEWPANAAAAPVAAVQSYYRDLLGFELNIDRVNLPAPAVAAAHVALYKKSAINWTLAEVWGLDPGAPPGAVAFPSLTYQAFRDKVRDHFRYGTLYEASPADNAGVGKCHDLAEKLYIWGATVGTPQQPSTAIYGSADRMRDTQPAQVGNPARWRRLCFSSVKTTSTADPVTPKQRIDVEFSAAGQTRTAVLTWNMLSKVGNVTPAHKRAMRDALAALVVLLGAGPYDVDLTITLRFKTGNKSALGWCPSVRIAALEVFDAHYKVIDANAAADAMLQCPWGGKPAPLTSAAYADAVRKVIKSLVLEVAERLRHVEQRDLRGLVYLCVAPAANVGNFGIGGNITGGRVGVGYVTEFPTHNFAAQLMLSLTDVLGHEFGHAFWRNHAPTASFGFAPFDKEGGHTLHDTCLMNYDLEPRSQNFCAHCVLLLRGWRDLDDPLTRDEAQTALEAQIPAEGDARAEAWLYLRRARFETAGLGHYSVDGKALTKAREDSQTAWEQPNRDRALARTRAQAGQDLAHTMNNRTASARLWISRAEAGMGANNDAQGIALLRAIIRAYITIGDLDDAWRLWGDLKNVTALTPDLRDAPSGNDHMLPGIAQTVKVGEGAGYLATSVTQYLNLPKTAVYVGGTVTHLDRLGRRIKVEVTTTGPLKWISWALLRHKDDGLLPHETVVPEPFTGADPNFTGASIVRMVAMVGHDGTTLASDTTTTVEFDLPDRPGRYKFAVEGAGRVVLSPLIDARAAIFVMSTVVSGNAAANATPDGPIPGELNNAFARTGFEFIHIGRRGIDWPGGVYADDLDGNTKAIPFVNAAHGARAHAATSPFSPTLASFEAHAPYLVQVIFVEKIARWAGMKSHSARVDLTRAAPTHTINVLMKGNFPAQLWEGTPADVNPDANGPLPRYDGRNHAKRWVVSATFTDTTGKRNIPLSALTASASDLAAPTKLDRVEVDLGAFADINGAIKGTVDLLLVVAKFVAGVDATPYAPAKGMTILVTDHAAPAQRSALIHEVSHMFGLVTNDGEHPSYYNIGTGPHCHAGIAKFTGQGMGNDYYPQQIATATCVMYHRVKLAAPLVTFCDDCRRQAQVSTWRRFT